MHNMQVIDREKMVKFCTRANRMGCREGREKRERQKKGDRERGRESVVGGEKSWCERGRDAGRKGQLRSALRDFYRIPVVFFSPFIFTSFFHSSAADGSSPESGERDGQTERDSALLPPAADPTHVYLHASRYCKPL